MEEAQAAMQKMLNGEIFILLLLVFGILVCIFFPGKSERKQKKAALLCLTMVVMLIIYILTSTIPFIKECHAENIVVARGLYTNVLGGRKTTLSGKMGTYSVKLEVDGQEIKLTTAPWCKKVFIRGEYEVIAYYLPNTKTLLHIEMITG